MEGSACLVLLASDGLGYTHVPDHYCGVRVVKGMGYAVTQSGDHEGPCPPAVLVARWAISIKGLQF